MSFPPVRTLEELDALDDAQIREGYLAAERGDPEPGENRGKAYWHGWRNRMIDLGVLPSDDAARALVKAYVAREGERRRAEHSPLGCTAQ